MTQPGTRDRYLDALRAAAIARVVVYHMFGFAWLSYAFPAMGVMFALGGSLMAASMQRSAAGAVRSRVRRLLPALWAMGLLLIPAMLWRGWTGNPLTLLLWALPLADPPGAAWADDVTVVLWYLVTYLWLVLLSPAAWRLFRRLPLVTMLLPLVILAGISFASQSGFVSLDGRFGSVLTDVTTFAACWYAGFAHRTGALRRLPLPLLLAVSAALLAAGTAWALSHPSPDSGASDLNDIPLAQALYCLGFVLPVLRIAPRMTWLRRFRPLDALVTLLNTRAVTIYLWHNAAIAACFVLGDALGVWRIGPTLEQVGYFTVALALLTVVVLGLGWVEDVAARRPPRLFPIGRAAPSRPSRKATSSHPFPDAAPPLQRASEPARHVAEPARHVAEPARHGAEPARHVAEPTQDAAQRVRDFAEPVRHAAEPAGRAAQPLRDVGPSLRDVAQPVRDIAPSLRDVAQQPTGVGEPSGWNGPTTSMPGFTSS